MALSSEITRIFNAEKGREIQRPRCWLAEMLKKGCESRSQQIFMETECIKLADA